jgi:hypothetical protein
VPDDGDVLSAARAELRAAPPDAFVETRKELAARLTKEGHRTEAAELRKDRRPQLGAWGVNQLVDAAAQELVDLVEVSDHLAGLLGASIDADAAVELREAMRERQQLLQELADRADAAMRGAGHPGHRDEMLATIDAASGDETHRAELLEGRLARVLPPPARFGPLVAAAPDAPARAPKAEPVLATVTELPRRDGGDGGDARARKAQEREAARIAQRVERATEVVARRTDEADAAAAEREAADEERDAAAARVAQAEADLAAAREELRRAEQSADRARAKDEQAAAKLADAQRALDEARDRP